MPVEEHYLVVDLEATCSEDGSIPRPAMEIIEIGAVMVAARDLTPIAEFQAFVRPVRRPRLTAFCTGLTSIQQADVDAAPTFPEVLPRFVSWAASQGPFVFCSWGNYDRNQLMQDCAHHKLAYPFPGRHLNVKAEFAKHFGLPKKVGTAEALRLAGVERSGVHHRGIDDARSIARLLPLALGEKRNSS